MDTFPIFCRLFLLVLHCYTIGPGAAENLMPLDGSGSAASELVEQDSSTPILFFLSTIDQPIATSTSLVQTTPQPSTAGIIDTTRFISLTQTRLNSTIMSPTSSIEALISSQVNSLPSSSSTLSSSQPLPSRQSTSTLESIPTTVIVASSPVPQLTSPLLTTVAESSGLQAATSLVAPTSTVQPSTLQPSVEPTSTLQPGVEPTSTLQPGVEPTSTLQPGVEPTSTLQPGVEPTSTLQPGVEPTSTLQPGVEPTSTLQPSVEPTSILQPGVEPTSTLQPTTSIPPSTEPTTSVPPSTEPTTSFPPSTEPTTSVPPSTEPTTSVPPSTEPTTSVPPSTEPTTSVPPSTEPTTSVPPSIEPTTSVPPSTEPTTSVPPSTEPTTSVPPSTEPTTSVPPSTEPTTSVPPSTEPTTSVPPSIGPMPSETGAPPTTGSAGTTDNQGSDDESSDAIFGVLTMEILYGIGAGGAIIVILFVVVIVLCCCCCCGMIKKRRRKRRYPLNARNPQPTSIFSNTNGKPPKYNKRRQSNGSMQAYELAFVQVEDGSRMFQEASPVVLEDYLRDMSQNHDGDPFKDPLPHLTPLSYPSQMMDGFYNVPLDEQVPERQLSAVASGSPPFMSSTFPHSSPSLRMPTRMALSLEKEESKSLQGSKVSIPGSGSKSQSYQGSRVSITGSRTISNQGSRSSFFNNNPSLLGDRHDLSQEEDLLSLQLSGRAMSPLLRSQNLDSSLDDGLVPTRDSPMPGVAPMATSHAIGHGKKDFASLTCIPNYQAVEAAELDLPLLSDEELAPDKRVEPHSPTAEGSGGRKKTTGKINLEALTILPGQEPKKPSPSKQTGGKDTPKVDKTSEKPKNESKSSPAAKKPRSRTMSRLEKLTSLDYIRASLRLKKKKVSFKTAAEPSPKSKTKKIQPDQLTFTNPAAIDREDSLDSPRLPSPGLYPDQQRPMDDYGPDYLDDIYSPDIIPDEFPFQRHYRPKPQGYLDAQNPYLQLSQPTYYPHMGQFQPMAPYPQLSQQYYPQPPYQPYPGPHMGGAYPYGRRYSDAPIHVPPQYPDMERYSDMGSSSHAGTRFRSVGSPHHYLETSNVSDRYDGTRSPDRFTVSTNMSDRYTDMSVDRYTDTSDRYNDLRSPDRFTESSYTNDRYEDMGSPTRFKSPDGRDERYREWTPDRYMDSMHTDNGGSRGNRAPGRLPDHRQRAATVTSPLETSKTAPRTRVSWSSEVIEYPRTPSEDSQSDYDL